MKVLLALACALVSAQAVSFHQVAVGEWDTWKLFHGKNYSNMVEENFRMEIFMENLAKIEKHNTMANGGEIRYFLKMNHFGDLVSNSKNSYSF